MCTTSWQQSSRIRILSNIGWKWGPKSSSNAAMEELFLDCSPASRNSWAFLSTLNGFFWHGFAWLLLNTYKLSIYILAYSVLQLMICKELCPFPWINDTSCCFSIFWYHADGHKAVGSCLEGSHCSGNAGCWLVVMCGIKHYNQNNHKAGMFTQCWMHPYAGWRGGYSLQACIPDGKKGTYLKNKLLTYALDV